MEAEIDYRNAKYQGQTDSRNQQRSGQGILIDDDLSLYTSQWKNGKLNGPTAIYISHGKYIYGQWVDNQPHGLNVFRIGDTVILSQFNTGQLIKKALIIFQKVSFIAIIERNKEEQWRVIESGSLYNYSQLLRYIKDAEIPMQPHYFSLVKFLNSISSSKMKIIPCKLSQNCYFGFDQGLGIVFNPNNGVVSVGSHQNRKLVEFGGKYQLPNYVIQGNFQTNEIIKYTKQRPHAQIYHIFQKIHKKSLNFRNQYFDSKVKLLSNLEQLVRSKIDQIINNQKQNTFTVHELNDSLDYHAQNIEQINRIYKVREQVYETSIPVMKKATSTYVQESSSPYMNYKKSPSNFTPTRNKELIKNAPASPILMKKTPSKTPNKSPLNHRKSKNNYQPISNQFDKESSSTQNKGSTATSRVSKSSIKDRIDQRRERSPKYMKYVGQQSPLTQNLNEIISSKQYTYEKRSEDIPKFNYKQKEEEDVSIQKYLEYREQMKKVKNNEYNPQHQKKTIQGPKYEDLSQRRKRILKQFQQLNRDSQISVSPTPKNLLSHKSKRTLHQNEPQQLQQQQNHYSKTTSKYLPTKTNQPNAQMMPLSLRMANQKSQPSPQESPANILKSFNRQKLGFKKNSIEKSSPVLSQESSPVELMRKDQQNYPSVERFIVDQQKEQMPNFGRKQSYHEQKQTTPTRKRPYKYYFD